MNAVIIFCAKYLVFIVALIAFIYWLKLPRKQKATSVIFGAITILVAFILAKIGGALFYDARPFVADHVAALFKYTADNGFPSDHTLLAASIALAILAVSKKWGLGLLLLSVVVGASRVLARVHHPIDIIGSLVFVAIGGGLAYYLTPKIMARIAKSSYSKRFGLESAN